MGFLQDIGDSLTGKAGINAANKQYEEQLSFNQKILDEQYKEAQLKNNPILVAQHNKIVIVVSIVAGIVLIVLIRKLL